VPAPRGRILDATSVYEIQKRAKIRGKAHPGWVKFAKKPSRIFSALINHPKNNVRTKKLVTPLSSLVKLTRAVTKLNL
jgi:hypothetical protein